MSYPQFNLTTLQLPAPVSNMTKAEYKDAYGIDLDAINIKAVKLVLLDNEKYPIDQIKEVEDGIEIYFNGRILSITDIVQTSDEVYDVSNSKPIYCHPITLMNASKTRVSILIFNNTPTAFTKETFMSWLDQLYIKVGTQTRILCSGAFIDSDSNVIIASYMGKLNSTTYYFQGCYVGDCSSIGRQFTAEEFMTFVDTFIDGVNIIN